MKRAYTDNGLNILAAEVDISDYILSDNISCIHFTQFLYWIKISRQKWFVVMLAAKTIVFLANDVQNLKSAFTNLGPSSVRSHFSG